MKGIVVYFMYGAKHSVENKNKNDQLICLPCIMKKNIVTSSVNDKEKF